MQAREIKEKAKKNGQKNSCWRSYELQGHCTVESYQNEIDYLPWIFHDALCVKEVDERDTRWTGQGGGGCSTAYKHEKYHFVLSSFFAQEKTIITPRAYPLTSCHFYADYVFRERFAISTWLEELATTSKLPTGTKPIRESS